MPVLLFLALLAASYWDIRKAEVPDWLSYGLAAAGLLSNMAISAVKNDYSYAIESLAFGLLFFLFGLALFRLNSWGGGDAKLIAGIGAFLNRDMALSWAKPIWPLQITFLLNMMLVAVFYYAVTFAVRLAKGEKPRKALRKGIRFVPIFMIAFACTFFLGDMLYSIISFFFA